MTASVSRHELLCIPRQRRGYKDAETASCKKHPGRDSRVLSSRALLLAVRGWRRAGPFEPEPVVSRVWDGLIGGVVTPRSPVAVVDEAGSIVPPTEGDT